MANGFQNYSQTQQYPQQFFPQSQGSVYLINNSLEVANVPLSGGVSVAICMNEDSIYFKSLQNGAPVLMAYKLVPYSQENPQIKKDDLKEIVSSLVERIDKLESQLKRNGGKINELV